MTELWEFIANSLEKINLPVTVIAALIGAVVSYITVKSHFISLIDKRINSDEYISQIADKLRPSVIFDQEERILSDNGAMSYIEVIKVTGDKINISTGEVKRPKEIVISSKEYLRIIPLLESLDERYEITPERGKKFEIIYKLRGTGYFMNEASSYRFRLEIIR